MGLEVKKQICDAHPNQEIVAKCGMCPKGICRACIANYGYFCSEECLEKSKALAIPEEYSGSSIDSLNRSHKIMSIVKWSLLAIISFIILLFLYRSFIAGYGEINWEVSAPTDISPQVEFLDPGEDERIRFIAGNKLYNFDLDGDQISVIESDHFIGSHKEITGKIIVESATGVTIFDQEGEKRKNNQY